MTQPLRVLIVDDSRIFRSALEEALREIEGVEVIGSVFSGEKALDFIAGTRPDLVTLDVEMPGQGGLETLRKIHDLNAKRPSGIAPIGVLIVSALTLRGAQVTVEVLQQGAFDFLTKPNLASAEENRCQLRQQLQQKIRAWRTRHLPGHLTDAIAPDGKPSRPTGRPCTAVARPHHSPGPSKPIRAILMAASTGGPEALAEILPQLCHGIELPILIVQHMPIHFTKVLADNLARRCSHHVCEATDGALVEAKTVYLAPGGKHLLLRRSADGRLRTALTEHAPENGCRPSADVLFRSAAVVLGGECLAVVLTGMGCDGTQGVCALKRAGAYVIAQDEASSVVWGMPGAAVSAGGVDEILPLSAIAAAVKGHLAKRGSPL